MYTVFYSVLKFYIFKLPNLASISLAVLIKIKLPCLALQLMAKKQNLPPRLTQRFNGTSSYVLGLLEVI
jgi:hypothetical protein